METVTIVQQYIPAYRQPFFNALQARLLMDDIRLRVVAGLPVGAQAVRGDAVDLGWSIRATTRTLRCGRRALSYVSAPEESHRSALYIFEQALSNVAMWHALLGPTGRCSRVALWGHGRTVVRSTLRVERRALRWATRRADFVFAYTAAGARMLQKDGLSSDRIAVVQNSLDTSALVDAVKQSESSGLPFRRRRNALYIGGLDPAKRIQELLAIGELVARNRPDFRLIVLGDGPLAGLVRQKAAQVDWLTYLGYSNDPNVKAKAAAEAACLVLPGRVGLAVVDAFALELPVVATRNRGNAPEFEYLEHADNSLIGDGSIASTAHHVLDLLEDDSLRERLTEGARAAGRTYSLETMIENFAIGVRRALQLEKAPQVSVLASRREDAASATRDTVSPDDGGST